MSNKESYDAELELIKKRKMLEYQRQLQQLMEAEVAKQRYEMEKEKILKSILTPKARSRLSNLKIVRPEFVEKLELQLIQLAQSGRIAVPITDEVLREILINITRRNYREIRIIRK
ncbi:MAG TPA: DNA-binding protein [Thermoprotei archaeon]|nr:DNA-binding protein [Thermoprotei archaeon]